MGTPSRRASRRISRFICSGGRGEPKQSGGSSSLACPLPINHLDRQRLGTIPDSCAWGLEPTTATHAPGLVYDTLPCSPRPRSLPTRRTCRARMAADACSLGVTSSRNLRELGLLGSNSRHLSAVITALRVGGGGVAWQPRQGAEPMGPAKSVSWFDLRAERRGRGDKAAQCGGASRRLGGHAAPDAANVDEQALVLDRHIGRLLGGGERGVHPPQVARLQGGGRSHVSAPALCGTTCPPAWLSACCGLGHLLPFTQKLPLQSQQGKFGPCRSPAARAP